MGKIDRRKFIRGTGYALALPWLETFASQASAAEKAGIKKRKRFASFYLPNGVPMPLAEDSAHKDWSWFPQGSGKDFTFTKCLDPLEALRKDLTVISGLSHPSARKIHGHSNADQFLTGANTGGRGDYQNSISLDQVFAEQMGEETRISSLVLSTDGGAGTPRGTHTMSFGRNGRAIPAENKPKRIFDMMFVKNDGDAARRLALSQSALDELMADARSLRRDLSSHDQGTLDEFLDSVRSTEQRVSKASKWLDVPLPTVAADHLNLNITPDDPREYIRTMYELIYLAFKTDSTRTATYMIGKELGDGISDYLARAIGLSLTHKLSHDTTTPGGWKNFGSYCRFQSEEFARFAARLKATPEVGGEGNMLDNTLLFYGSASSAFHLSRNYPLLLVGGKNMGYKHGQFLDLAQGQFAGGAWFGGPEPYKKKAAREDLPLSNLYVTMLQRLGVETETFADSTGDLSQV
ncbi:DUF1552 domain-containing protein [Akkermansiaceae bacterium]|nr:DUF1552 domain-containing protein [Akkermansiaceae bacterium]MDB4387253.1 DUF1552 domain-containing protein [Akkermansiaceae bacterium]MDB4429573.1 DUF1552 domain-containing protein [Akkermansiaceae bacterium]MDB4525580.1 DUF1552 domain-containing protein [Akkermansiaceae bacterium]